MKTERREAVIVRSAVIRGANEKRQQAVQRQAEARLQGDSLTGLPASLSIEIQNGQKGQDNLN